MSDKPKKLSNVGRLDFTDETKVRQYIASLDQDIFNIVQYLDRFPRFFEQATEPTIQRNTFAFWSSSGASNIFLIANISGGQKRVQLI